MKLATFETFFHLTEMRKETLERITKSHNDRFNSLFKGKQRFAIPANITHPALNDLKGAAEDMGYEIDAEAGTIQRKEGGNPQKLTKWITREIDKVKNTEAFNKLLDDEITPFDTFASYKIGQSLHSKMKKYFIKKNYKNIAHMVDSGNNAIIFKDPNYKYNQEALEALKDFDLWWDKIAPKEIKKIILESPKIQLDYVIEFAHYLVQELNLNWKQFRKIIHAASNLSTISQKWHIIFSRNPIDIARMSDFEAIQSCHSEGGSYFDCAIAEANEGGIITYLVNDTTFQKIKDDLNSNGEIFGDRKRDIGGPQPDGRLRVRALEHTESGHKILIPEFRTYGKFANDVKTSDQYYHEVKEYLKANYPENDLKDFINDAERDGRLPFIELSEWRLMGGEYEDTSAKELMQEYYDSDGIKFRNSPKPPGGRTQVEIWNEELSDFFQGRIDFIDDWDIKFDIDRYGARITNLVVPFGKISDETHEQYQHSVVLNFIDLLIVNMIGYNSGRDVKLRIETKNYNDGIEYSVKIHTLNLHPDLIMQVLGRFHDIYMSKYALRTKQIERLFLSFMERKKQVTQNNVQDFLEWDKII